MIKTKAQELLYILGIALQPMMTPVRQKKLDIDKTYHRNIIKVHSDGIKAREFLRALSLTILYYIEITKVYMKVTGT